MGSLRDQIREIIETLRRAKRTSLGQSKDIPDGALTVILSDALALQWAQVLDDYLRRGDE